MIKIPETCRDCEYKGSDSCRDAVWYICAHEVFEIGEEPAIKLDDTPPKTCPLRKQMDLT